MIKALVRFEDGIPDDIQAKCMFDFEVNLRERSGLDIWVYKDRMKDDSPLRIVVDARRLKK